MITGDGPSRLAAEARARVLIDRQLVEAGWSVQDKKAMNLFAAQGVAVREVTLKPGHGRADYLLYVDQRVVGVVEAKPEGTPRSGVEWQSSRYAEGLPAEVKLAALTKDGRLPFVFEAAADAYLQAANLRGSKWHGGLTDNLLWRDEYPRVEVRSLLREPMRNGRSDRAVADGATGTRTLTITAVTKNAFTAENTKITTTTADRARGLWLEPGDVLVQRSNTPDLVGTSARYDGPPGWAIFPDLLIRLRADEKHIDSRFLAAALRSERGHRQLREKAKCAAGSMPKIDQAAIGAAMVPLPSLDLQAAILDNLRDATDAATRLWGELDAAARRSASLRRSMLAAAFSGRLTGDREFAGV